MREVRRCTSKWVVRKRGRRNLRKDGGMEKWKGGDKKEGIVGE